jgi:hypothetical protein
MGFSIVGNTASNVGQILGDASKGILKNFVIFGGTLTSSQTADAASRTTALKAASLKSKSDSGKLFWLPEIQNIEDRAEADKEGTLNLGYKSILVEGKPAYEVKVFGSSEFNQAIRGFNGQIVRVMEYDSNEKLWGCKSGTSFQGYQAKIQTRGQKGATGQNVEEGVVTIVISFLDTTEYYNSSKFIDLSDVDLSDIKSQVDATLSYVSNTTNAYKISVGVPTAEHNVNLDMYDYYSTQLASASLWKAGTGTNYATALTITSVSADAATKSFVVTFDTTAYSALNAGTKIKLELKDPATLDAAGVEDVEGVPVVLTKA